MPLYLTRFSYTPSTWGTLIKSPEDRRTAARQYIETVGGQLHGFWYAFGEHEDVRREIDELTDEYTLSQIANILNERGLRTGAGAAFDVPAVKWVYFSAKLIGLKQRLLAAGWMTTRQTTAKLGVSRTTLGKWRLAGRLKGRICTGLGEWLYCPLMCPCLRPTQNLPLPRLKKTARLQEVHCECRSFGIDVWTCHCGGRRTIRSLHSTRKLAEARLIELGVALPSRVLPPATAPPQLLLAM